MLRSLLKLSAGAFVITALASGFGLATNALRPDALPLIRKPLRETRAVVSKADILPDNPVPAVEPTAPSAPPPTPVAEPTPEPEPLPKAEVPTPVQNPEPVPAKPVEEKPAVPQIAKEPEPEPVQALFTTLEDAKSLFVEGSAIFLDARPVEDYNYEHIKGAKWLYSEQIDQLYQKTLGRISKDRIIITYCSDPECTSAVELADALLARGHKKVVILLEGLPGWKDAGWPTEGEGL